MENKVNKNYNQILNILSNNKRECGSLGIEHLGDLAYLLEKYDSKSILNDDKLREALLLLTKRIVESELAKISFDLAYNYIFPPPYNELNFDKIEFYVNNNWDNMDKVDRLYLIAFE